MYVINRVWDLNDDVWVAGFRVDVSLFFFVSELLSWVAWCFSSPFGRFAPPFPCLLSLLPWILPYFYSISAFHPPQLAHGYAIFFISATSRIALSLCAVLRNSFSLLSCSSLFWFVPCYFFSLSISIFRFPLAFELSLTVVAILLSLFLCCVILMSCPSVLSITLSFFSH